MRDELGCKDMLGAVLVLVLLTAGIVWAAADSSTTTTNSGTLDTYGNGDLGNASEINKIENRSIRTPIYVNQVYSTPGTVNTPGRTPVAIVTPVATPGTYAGCSVRASDKNPDDICIGGNGVLIQTGTCPGGASWCCSGGWPLAPGESRSNLDARNGDCDWISWIPASGSLTTFGVTLELRGR